MAKNFQSQSRSNSSQPPSMSYAAAAAARPPSLVLFAAGSLLLIAATGTSLMLTLEHFGGLSLPGCGAGSPCAQAAASKWGSIPISDELKWPVSLLGLAYFAGLL